jgi:hypothetical protein
MTVIVTAGRAAAMVAAGVQNNPVVGVDSIYARAGTITAGGATAPNALDGATYTYWTPGSFIGLTYDVGSAVSCDFAAIAAHDLHVKGASIRPQHSPDGTTWTDAAGGAVVATTGETIIWLFEAISRRYWRFLQADPGGKAAASVGCAFIGRSLTFDSRFYAGYNDARYPTEVELLTNSTGSHVLGTSVLRRGSSVEWGFKHLSEAFVTSADFGAFVAHFNAGRGFFGAWRPAESGVAYYAWRAGGTVQPSNGGPETRKDLTLQLRVYHDF